jgi:superfamily I DNA and/or RNA helicase
MVDEAVALAAGAERALDISTTTLFGELYLRLPPPCRVRLSTQYRSHEDIGRLVDEVFYRPFGEGLASYYARERAVQRRPRYGVLGDKPLAWVDVARPPKPCAERNDAEVEAVVGLLRQYAAAGAPDGAVAVICPYELQRKALLKRIAKEDDLDRMGQILNIDQVQGREYEAVILTLVRTDGRPGFLASPNRVNVAVSRAQRQLVVVGSSEAFLRSRMVKRHAPHLVEVIRMLTSDGRTA